MVNKRLMRNIDRSPLGLFVFSIENWYNRQQCLSYHKEMPMTYRVLLRKEPTNGYVATALDWPHCQVAAPTREAALTQIQAAIVDLLTTGEIVDLEIPTPVIPAPYADTFGMFQDDPTFAAFLEEVNHYRQARNQAPVD